VTVSVIALAALGVDVRSLAAPDGRSPAWFVSPETMNLAAWRDVLLMRVGPWAFEIIGLYVWLVVAALPCLFILRYAAGGHCLPRAGCCICGTELILIR
jgi:hypothetical protein